MRLPAAVVALAAVALLARAADDPPNPGKQFTATFKMSGGPQGDRQIAGTIIVNRYTPLPEAQQLKEILKSQGQAGLANAIRGRANGQLSLGGLAYSLDLVVFKPSDDGFEFVIVTTRPIRLQESQEGSPSLDYPFGVVFIKLDGFGRGDGRFYPTSALRINPDGTLDVEQFNQGEGRVTDVQKQQ